MPPSAAEHADIMWIIIIGLISLAGTACSIAAAGWARAGKIQSDSLKEDLSEVKINQRDLAKSISNVHNRIDGVCKDIADVDKSVHELRGRIKPLEKIYDKVEIQ